MIPAELYESVYLITILLFSIPVFVVYNSGSVLSLGQNNNRYTIVALFLTIAMILFVGLRPNSSIFVDGPGYYYAMINHRFEETPLKFSDNFLFVALMSFMSSISTPPQVAFIVLAFINFFFTFIAARKLFPNSATAAMLVFFASFSTFSYSVNGIKAGCAAAIFLCALAYHDNWKLSLIFLISAMGFHHSMELPIVAYIICSIYKRTNVYFIIWIVSFLIALLHITYFQYFFADFTDEHGAGYLIVDEDTLSSKGFRMDFVVYSFSPILIWLIVKTRYAISSDVYDFLINVYLLVNSIWMLCMYAEFTNRIAYLSWGILPFVLIYPFLNENLGRNGYKLFSFVFLFNLCFTLFMHFIYYA